MIRSVLVARVRAGVPAEDVEKALTALRELRIAGLEFSLVAGVDLGIREGNADFAVTVDLPDEAAYRVYDADPEHNRIRAELVAPICEKVDRIQFALPG